MRRKSHSEPWWTEVGVGVEEGLGTALERPQQVLAFAPGFHPVPELGTSWGSQICVLTY